MTEIREQGFEIDLPGEWERSAPDEPGARVYTEAGSGDALKVMLLTVRPLFAIAEKSRLLEDYVRHRSDYETGKLMTLMHQHAYFEEHGDEYVAWWRSADFASAYKQQHRALLSGTTFVDACYASKQPDKDAFAERADEILGTLRVSAG